MSSRFVLGRENVPCVAEVVNRSLKADCTDFNNIHPWYFYFDENPGRDISGENTSSKVAIRSSF